MMQLKITPSKVNRPRLSRIVARGRLFDALDEAGRKPVIWITAPGGAGKTTLCASWLDARKSACLWYQMDAGDGDLAGFFYYLGLAVQQAAPRYKKSMPLFTPEYLQGVSIFTQRYFEELFRRIKTPATLVFDNYQDVPGDSGFHEMMASALATIPEGANIIILSRAHPPAEFSRLQANNHIALLDWEDIRFTREEAKILAVALGAGQQAFDRLYGMTEGWAAGLVLLTAQMKMGAATQAAENLSPREIFDYFASEIFGKTDPLVQRVLLQTAFLPRVEAAMAEKLTGIADVGETLERLGRDHYFTQRYGRGYQYHPLFREFLLSRARATFSSAELAQIQKQVAALLAEAGEFEQAGNLYVSAADWEGAVRLLLVQAPSLLAQGRSRSLEKWLTALPAEVAGASPWVCYWIGICRMLFDPGESRKHLEQAFGLFRKQADMTGVFLSWASIIDTFLYQWGDFAPVDRWLAIMEDLLAEHPEFPSPEIEARVAAGMLNAMTWRQPARPELPVWAEQVRQIIFRHSGDQLRVMLGSYLIIYYLWIGDFAKAGLLLDTLRTVGGNKDNDPLTQQNWRVMEAMHAWLAADNKACMEAVYKGLKSAEESGVHLLDLYLLGQGVYSGMSLGDPASAISCLEKMSQINSPRLMDRSFYHYQASSVAWYQGDLKKAIEHGRLAVQFAEATGCHLSHGLCLAELAVTLFEDGQREEGGRQLGRAREVGQGMNLIGLLCRLHAARFAFEQGDDETGVAELRDGLALGARQGYVNIPRWNNDVMSQLCARALQHGIETDYVRRLIKARNLARPESATSVDWPVSGRDGEARLGEEEIEAKVAARTQVLLEQNRYFEQLALTDALTGLPNRRHALKEFDQKWAESSQINAPLACLLIDADGFKQINDSYGHDAGDEVLRQLSACLRKTLRMADIVCRLGGDEFLVICPGATRDNAMMIAEKLRKAVSLLRVPAGDGEWCGSISVGVAARRPGMENPDDLIKLADEGVYIAKRNGRNCVATAADDC